MTMNLVEPTNEMATLFAGHARATSMAAPPTALPLHGLDLVADLAEIIPSDGVFSHILTAALINRRFRQMLLTNPNLALTIGYREEPFVLSAAEKEIILSVRATTLVDFARGLLTAIQTYNQRVTAPEQL
jgi:hypothetical protein